MGLSWDGDGEGAEYVVKNLPSGLGASDSCL
jgi:hypothetical protein